MTQNFTPHYISARMKQLAQEEEQEHRRHQQTMDGIEARRKSFQARCCHEAVENAYPPFCGICGMAMTDEESR